MKEFLADLLEVLERHDAGVHISYSRIMITLRPEAGVDTYEDELTVETVRRLLEAEA